MEKRVKAWNLAMPFIYDFILCLSHGTDRRSRESGRVWSYEYKQKLAAYFTAGKLSYDINLRLSAVPKVIVQIDGAVNPGVSQSEDKQTLTANITVLKFSYGIFATYGSL